MDLSFVITRLQAQLIGIKSIGSAVDLDAAMTGLVATPAVWVVPLGESSQPNDLLSQTGEVLSLSFGVVQVVKNRRDAAGAAAAVDLAGLRSQLKTALVGWVPDAATGEPVHFAAGKLMRLDGDGLLWWMDEFTLTTFYWSA